MTQSINSQTGHTIWQSIPGEVRDISIGTDGSVWAIGIDEVNDDGYGIYQWNGDSWDQLEGIAIRVAIEPNGCPWVINASGKIFRRIDDEWQRLPGSARYIDIAANGAVWIIGTEDKAQGGRLYQWNGEDWEPQAEGEAQKISLDSQGNPWIINASGKIYRLVDEAWERISGTARDIGIGADDSVWIVGTDEDKNDNCGIYYRKEDAWIEIDGKARKISVEANGAPWVVNAKGQIYFRMVVQSGR